VVAARVEYGSTSAIGVGGGAFGTAALSAERIEVSFVIKLSLEFPGIVVQV
jgi:hypothetical protein